jgi:hypothetical protein
MWGMRSGQILLEHWDDPDGYRDAILKEFAWMKRERHVLDKLVDLKPLGLDDAMVLKRSGTRLGIKVGTKDAAMLLSRLGRRRRTPEIKVGEAPPRARRPFR